MPKKRTAVSKDVMELAKSLFVAMFANPSFDDVDPADAAEQAIDAAETFFDVAGGSSDD